MALLLAVSWPCSWPSAGLALGRQLTSPVTIESLHSLPSTLANTLLTTFSYCDKASEKAQNLRWTCTLRYTVHRVTENPECVDTVNITFVWEIIGGKTFAKRKYWKYLGNFWFKVVNFGHQFQIVIWTSSFFLENISTYDTAPNTLYIIWTFQKLFKN